MIKSLLFIAIAPVLIVALYIYIRDKYEKEPIFGLIKALLTGVLIVLPIVFIERFLSRYTPENNTLAATFYSAFAVASLTEEGFKYFAFMIFYWHSRNFNEKFDGIVYAVFISLGFAAVENVIYVYQGGYTVGMIRAVTAVPGHALFGTSMGYHFGFARFYPDRRIRQLILAFLMPFLWHGIYDFLVMGGKTYYLLLFIPLLIFFWINGFRQMKELSMASFFRTGFLQESGESKKDPDES